MAEAEHGGGDKTEAATPRRLQKARESGQAALSREAAPFAVLVASALLLSVAGRQGARDLAGRLAGMLAAAPSTDPGHALRTAGAAALLLAGPFLLVAVLAAVVAVIAQTGGLVNLGALRPDLSRLSPRRGLSRVLSPTALLEAGKSILKLAAAGSACWFVLTGALPMLPTALFWDPAHLLGGTTREVEHVLLAVLAAQGVIAGFDIMRARFSHGRGLRMSRQEVRDEYKETEGDPQIKARIRRLRLQRAKRRMMAAVPKAALVVTNPTHYAVALAYERSGSGAPKVVAKGVDTLAARIRDVARENNVPIVANPPLARALYSLELDTEIPREMYQAVAELIAYVWRLRGRAR